MQRGPSGEQPRHVASVALGGFHNGRVYERPLIHVHLG